MKIGQARLSRIAPAQRSILLEPGGWPRSANCSSAVPEAQPTGQGQVCKGPRQDVRCLHRDDLAAADSRRLSRFSVPLLPKAHQGEIANTAGLSVDARRKLRTHLGRFASLRYTRVEELNSSTLIASPDFLRACFEIQSDLLGDLLGRIGRREDLDANLGRLGKTDSRIDLLPPIRRKPRYIDGFDTIRGRDRALSYHDPVRQ